MAGMENGNGMERQTRKVGGGEWKAPQPPPPWRTPRLCILCLEAVPGRIETWHTAFLWSVSQLEHVFGHVAT